MGISPVVAQNRSKVTPKDFFLWTGAMLGLYLCATSLITLLFEYVNHAFPDQLLTSPDPYSTSIRLSMAALIVLTPTTLLLMCLIRNSIEKEPSKANIWVRRWALMLTLFVAGASIVIDLITLVNTFLGGEVSMRFLLKVSIVLLVAAWVFLHFLADVRGYWITSPKKANLVGVAAGVLAVLVIVAGFFIIGTPGNARLIRYDEQKVSDLRNIQSQVVNYWQQKHKLPTATSDLNDPISGYLAPRDPQSGTAYGYTALSAASFKLCAVFNRPTQITSGNSLYPTPPAPVTYPMSSSDISENWQHAVGETCFMRTIDPERYPPSNKLP